MSLRKRLAAILVCAPKSRGVAILALLAFLSGSVAALAHTFARTRTDLVIDRDSNFEVTLRLDLDTLALGLDPATPPEVAAGRLQSMSEDEFKQTEEGLRRLLSRRLRVRVDSKPLPFELSFPERRPRATPGPVEVFGLTARLQGRLSENGKEIQFFASRSFPAIELSFVNQATGDKAFHICLPGEECPKIPLKGAPEITPAEFVGLGFEHIVPMGLDHILFVLALFLGGRDPRTLLIQTGLFTLAHSATLALSTYGVFSLSPRLVEPLIALSIALVGFENAFMPRGVSTRRAVVVFCFGLLHGLGFAGALAQTPLGEGSRLLGLLLFNLGVELGQVAVLVAALLLSLPFRDPLSYRQRIERPLSIALVAVGTIWALTRLAA